MSAIASISDGFALAEEDLRVRGEGEVLGEKQSGLPRLKLTSLVSDLQLLISVREDAATMLADDPELSAPEHVLLQRHVRAMLEETLITVKSG
jgi:ATP-dependent DNA helicase RecG